MERSYREASGIVHVGAKDDDLISFVARALGLPPGGPAIWRAEIAEIEAALQEEAGQLDVGIACRYLPHRLALEVSLPGDIPDTALARIKRLLGANAQVKERTVSREPSSVRINWVYAL